MIQILYTTMEKNQFHDFSLPCGRTSKFKIFFSALNLF